MISLLLELFTALSLRGTDASTFFHRRILRIKRIGLPLAGYCRRIMRRPGYNKWGDVALKGVQRGLCLMSNPITLKN